MSEPLVLLEGVHKRYLLGEVEVAALRGVDLRVEPGEVVIILGPSGSGKTTLLNIIGGLDQPTEGRAVVAGRELGGLSEAALTTYRREVIGFVFQFFNLVPTLTARENVELVGELVKNPRDPHELLTLVGLGHREDHFPSSLSGGEQQRVAIARALVKRPALMLADEPTGSLDFETSIRVLRVIQDAQATVGCGVIIVTHNEEIARIAHRVVRIHSGRIASVEQNPQPAPAESLRW